ncbi:MAG: hypothetical protein U5K72_01580 [Balneolaceae bacterium]|nr:hypothetical protein [Balneolaceae bacterium]
MNPFYKSEKPTKDISVVEDENQLKEIFGMEPEDSVEEMPENNRKRFLKQAITLLGTGMYVFTGC